MRWPGGVVGRRFATWGVIEVPFGTTQPGADCPERNASNAARFITWAEVLYAVERGCRDGHRVDAIAGDIAALDARIDQEIAPFAAAVAKLDEVPGINRARRGGGGRGGRRRRRCQAR